MKCFRLIKLQTGTINWRQKWTLNVQLPNTIFWVHLLSLRFCLGFKEEKNTNTFFCRWLQCMWSPTQRLFMKGLALTPNPSCSEKRTGTWIQSSCGGSQDSAEVTDWLTLPVPCVAVKMSLLCQSWYSLCLPKWPSLHSLITLLERSSLKWSKAPKPVASCRSPVWVQALGVTRHKTPTTTSRSAQNCPPSLPALDY